ncbi:M1 family metallopeptidase [Chiayiivirga flava]|uniref:Aminopeptidase N n=1 Tax=Chiayiivirga flava TaxID=659595 RepID=A0A7W8D5X9_9GAMM|nr:M1 family metallopeptidase [Chiayiivirga flava]MBB5208137.1 aminopeptidase N [Chiayiivirga flava]
MRVLLPLALSIAMILPAFAAKTHDAPPRHHDEHSWAEPDKVVIRDLGLDLRVDFGKKQLRGSADLALTWKDPAARELLLDTRDLSIAKVLGKSGDGNWRRLQFSLGERDAIFGQKLTIRMKRQYDIVRIRYATAPEASGLQWLEPSMTAGKKHPFMFSQSQAIHARSWVPLQDTPGVRYTYSAHIETDPELMALMSADNAPDASRDGDYVFRMQQPIPSYLMAISVGDLVFRPISERAGVWAEPGTVDVAVKEFADTERMIQTTEQLYGPYRWERYDLLILPPSFPFGGMENPRLSFITPTVIVGDKSLTSLIAHELAHSWSGNLVTNASWKDMWLNEGFTSYVENRIVEAVYGTDLSQMENVISQFGLHAEMQEMAEERQVLALPALPGVDPDEALTDVAYIKGAWFLEFLEQRFGREAFDPFLRSYFNHFAFQSIDTAQFVEYLNSELIAKNPDAVTQKELDAWLNQPGIPAFATAAKSARFDAVDAARKAFLDGRKSAGELLTAAWTTQEWVRFLEGMPEVLTGQQAVDLDEAFKLTTSDNGEILQRWFPLTVRSGYFEARPAIAQFLQRIGRRKLVMPTYEALVATPDGKEFARQVFEKAKPGYHPITTASVEALLAKKP